MPLFHHSVTKKYSAGLDKPALNAAFEKFRTFFHNPERQKNIREAKEEQFQEGYFEAEAAKVQELKHTIDATDHEIDRMVYELYGLTKEEIAVVEGREATNETMD